MRIAADKHIRRLPERLNGEIDSRSLKTLGIVEQMQTTSLPAQAADNVASSVRAAPIDNHEFNRRLIWRIDREILQDRLDGRCLVERWNDNEDMSGLRRHRRQASAASSACSRRRQ